jgi:outer membrane protein assembly factor BamB
MSLEGQQIDRYRILRLLGSGGMGDVYLAEDARIEQQVAIKVIRVEASPYPDAHASQQAARLFQREAKAIAKLDHPHILPLYDYGEERLGKQTIIYLVMPYRQEGSLSDWLRQRGQVGLLSPPEVASLVRQAASALQHAHDRQIVHQDVKPCNFLIRHRPEKPTRPDLLLADFGVAKLSTATTSASQTVRGTPIYMAPEQWAGQPVPATDQYALAVMAYELLTGRPPFQGPLMQVMYQHVHTPPPPPSTHNLHLAAEVDMVLLHALTKQPEERFTSIMAFANAFQQAVQSMPGADAPTSKAVPPPTSLGDIRAVLAISTAEAQTGTTRALTLPGRRQVTVTVPAGVREGQIVRLEGQGDVSPEGGAVGALILSILVKATEDPPSSSTASAAAAEATVLTTKPEIPATSMPTVSNTGQQSTVSSTARPEVVTPPHLSVSPTEAATAASQRSLPPPELALPVKPSVGRSGELIPPAQAQQRAGVVPTGRSSQPSAPVTAQPPSFTAARSLGILEPAQRGVSRRTVVIGGLAGLAAVGVAGGGIAWLMHTQGPYVSSPTPNPTSPSSLRANPTLSSTSPVPSINSSGAMFGFDLQHTRFNPDEHILSPTNVSRLVQYWTASTGAFVFSSPAVANGAVYVSSDKLYALNASTGTLKWVYNTGGGGSSPAVANGVVYVGSGDYKLYALNASTGQTLWTSAPTGAGIISSPAVANGVVYVGSFDHKLYAFDASTGQTLWTSTPSGDRILSSPAVANGVVYVGSLDHKLYAFNASTGTILWTASTGDQIYSSPAIANGVVYVGSFDHTLHAFNASTGQTLWTSALTRAGIYSSPAVANGVVYAGSDDFALYAFNTSTGTTIWTSAPTGAPINSSPAVANGVVYVGSGDHKLYAFHLPGTTP